MNGRSGSALKWILLGCGGAVVLGVVAVGGCAILILNMTKPPVEASEKFLTAMGAADWAGAKAAADPTVAASLESVAKAKPAVWGKEWSVSGRFINTNNGVTTAVVTVMLKGTDGTTRKVELSLQDSGGWKVTAVKVNGEQVLPVGASGAPPGTGLRLSDPKIEKKDGPDGKTWVVAISGEVHGLTADRSGAQPRIKFHYGLTATSPTGEEFLRKPDFQKFDGVGEFGTFSFDLTLPKEAEKGTYKVAVNIVDDLSGDEATKMIRVELP